MQFFRALPQLLYRILGTDPDLRIFLMQNVYLADAYMYIWISFKYVSRLSSVITPHPSDVEKLIRFHLSLPMGYVNSMDYFFCMSKIFANLSNALVFLPPGRPTCVGRGFQNSSRHWQQCTSHITRRSP